MAITLESLVLIINNHTRTVKNIYEHITYVDNVDSLADPRGGGGNWGHSPTQMWAKIVSENLLNN